MKYYLKDVQDVFAFLKTGGNGLSSEEAAERLKTYGKNKLNEAKKTPLIKKFLQQFADPMIFLLLGAAAVSTATSLYSGESFSDVFIILFVVVTNAVLGVIQESKAENAIEALKEMTAAESNVLRDGEVKKVKSEDLVAGDVILLEAGDAVPADARVIECASLKIEEAALTGESVPVSKILDTLGVTDRPDIALGDRKNMVYMGSTVAYGRGKAVVCDTGMATEMGKIASALEATQDGQTPLQKKLAEISKMLTKLVLGICIFIFAFTLFKQGDFSGKLILSTFMTAVSLAVAAIPEGLPTVVTIVLSMGVTSMSKKNALIRKLTAVETLGCTQIICSDKTGTLTQNKMTVVEHYGDDEDLLATAMALCNDATIKKDEQAKGEPTEAALVNYAAKLGLYKPDLSEKYERIGEAPFDSGRKKMSTVHQTADGSIIQFSKGAPDELVKNCTKILRDGKEIALTDEIKKEILAKNKEFADQALRVLAAAYKKYDKKPLNYDPESLECDMVFVGLTGMIDPCREEVFDAIKECRNAGIRPIMITGDHKDTAVAIAKQLGIIESELEAITGSELEDMPEDKLTEEIQKYSVFARVQPEHKTKIVKAWQGLGRITAMTGDGVNDAPSIKTADIGVGMGITGTDVTKNVSDMVLADDNFATIVNAVEEGRKIYDNIRKVIQFQLSTNMAEVLVVFFGSLFSLTMLEPAHLLWINLITDCTPGLALGMERAEKSIMTRKPRSTDEGIFADGMGFSMIYQGLYITIVVVASYFIGHYIETGIWEIANSRDGITMAFLSLSMAETFHALNLRSRMGSIFKMGHENWLLWGATLLSIAFTCMVIYVPFLSNVFDFTQISLYEFSVSVALGVSVIPFVELVKFFERKVRKAK